MPTRRQVLRRGGATAGAVGGATVLAGCGGSGADEGEIPGFTPDGPTLTTMVPTEHTPENMQFNPYGLNPRGRPVQAPLQQLVLPADAPTGAFRTSGHSWTVDGETVSVTCAIADYDVDGETITYAFEEGLTYWSGEALDARAYSLGDRVRSHAFGEFGTGYPGEVVDDHTYRWTVADPSSAADVDSAVYPGLPPLPPAFTENWVERFEGASSETAADDVYADLSTTDVSVEAFVEEGYGSGAYEVASTGVISRQGIGAVLRADHPGDATVPNLVVRTPSLNTTSALVHEGGVDVGEGIIAEQGGDYQAASMPDGFEQVGRYPSPVQEGNQLFFNWGRPHLRRLWVRRAIAAALPVERMLRNAYGTDRRPVDQHSGVLSATAGVALGSAFVDSLHDYPVEADTETAGEWLRTAGYTLSDDGWTGPDGESLSLRLLVGQRTGPLATSLSNGLTDFGIDVEQEVRQLQPSNRFEPALLDGNYDLALGFSFSSLSVARAYGADPGIAGPSPFAAAGSVAGNPLGGCDGEAVWVSRPGTVTVPDDPGSLRIEGVTYDDGGTSYTHDGGANVDVCTAVERVVAPGTDATERQAAARSIARWYNYALPTFVFGQAQVGLFGNTGDFAFPDEAASHRLASPQNWSPARYHVQAGTIR